jgi:hypothetical protein
VIAGCCAIFAAKRYYRENKVVPAFFISAMLFAAVIRRPNFMYIIYVYPAFLLLLLWLSERRGKLVLAAGLVWVYLLPQYGLVYVQNQRWSLDAYLAQVRSLAPAGKGPVVGMPNDWFAFVDRPFFRVDYQGDFKAVAPDAFVLIEGEAFRKGDYPKVKDLIDQRYESAECGRFVSRGETIVVRDVRLKGRAF